MADPSVGGRLRRLLASIRTRMMLGFVALLALALASAILVTRWVQLAHADREIEIEQSQEIEELRRFAERGSDPISGRAFDEIYDVFYSFLQSNVPSDEEGFYGITIDGRVGFSPGSPDLVTSDLQFRELWNVGAITEPTRGRTHTEVDGVGEVRWLAVPVRIDGAAAGVFVVASFPADDYNEVHQLVIVLVLAALAVVALTTGLAWSLSGRVLRPVRDLTDTARNITENDLSARIPVEGHDELAHLGATFNDMVGRLEHGFDAQRRFLDDVAHELRTPITIARGHLEMIGDDPAERAETVAIVTDELDRMGRYVNDLLLLAKSEQMDFLIVRSVDLGDLALDVFQRVGALGERAWVLDQSPPVGAVAVLADADRLTQALINLADNAVGHTVAEDEIGIGIEVVPAPPGGATVRLWVRDTGPGVDPSVAETLFDRHTRGVTSRTRRSSGAGIGLSIVDAIARAHGGAVTVDSVAGRGATFIIAIPLRAASVAAAPAARPPQPSPSPSPSSRLPNTEEGPP